MLFDIRNENTLLFLHVAFYIPLFAIEYQHWINEQWNVTNKRYINSTIMLHSQKNQFHNILKKTLESLLNYITEQTLIIL